MPPFSSHTDSELLALLKDGEEAAYTEIYNRYWEQMSLYVLKVIRSEGDAQDIVQEVFVSIWKRREVLEVKGTLVAYLLRSVRNLSIRYIETHITKRDFLRTLSDSVQHLDLSGVNALELEQLEAQITGAIAGLPPKMREVFLLSRQENLSYKEIAHRLHIAETTVKKQVSNALQLIRTDLGGLSATAVLYITFLGF
jgi:RNA polymerase sigma-70 factor (family 1)